ncbi:MAG: hypothetical protein PHX34_04675 [Candidatus Shapirobacteria bacterium]|nr:hypothetical protein [Candidatus Shapirobacteria bacterium]
MSKRKDIFKLILILVFGLFIRLILLDRIPVGINDDELHFVLNAKSFFYGQNLSFSEMSSVVFAPIIGPLPLNLFTVKLPYAIISIFSVLLLYSIVKKLTKSSNLSLLIALVACLNPWSIYTARTSFDAPLAIFFFLLSLYLMVKAKPLPIFLSIITGFLAFNSYIGTKILYFPFIAISSFYCWKFLNKKLGKHYLLVTLFSLLITLNFIFSLSHQSVGQRLSELWTPASPKIAALVNNERRESLRPALSLFTNKYTIYFRESFKKYLNNFSPNVLFLTGDSAFTGSLWIHGYFYYLDILLIILGIIFLYHNYRYFLFLILSFILISPIPEAIRSDSIPAYVFHSSFQYPFLFVLLGSGAFYLFKKIKSKPLKIFFIFLYLLSFLNFLNIYFIKSPVYQSESFVFSHRLVSKYLNLENQKNRKTYFLTQQPELMFRSFLFYNNLFTRQNFQLIQKSYSQSHDSFTFGYVHFINNENLLPQEGDFTLIFDVNNFNFDDPGSSLFVSRISDAGKIFSIHHGTSCQNIKMETFVHDIKLSDLKIEKLNETYFCHKFITI